MHKVKVTKTNNKTGVIKTDITKFYSIYNAKRYIAEIELFIEDLRISFIEKNKGLKRNNIKPLENEVDIKVELIDEK